MKVHVGISLKYVSITVPVYIYSNSSALDTLRIMYQDRNYISIAANKLAFN